MKKIAYGLHQIAYGSEDGLYINGHVTGNSPYLTFEWKTDNESKYHEVQTRLIGEYNFPNALAAVTIGHFFGVEPEKIDKALAGYTPQNNRSQLKKTENNELIIDAYNANPSSMKVALDNFATMRELGPTSDELHTEVVARIKEGNYDKVFLCGEHFQKAAGKDFTTYATTEELIEALRKNPLEGYHVLIKGSHGMALERVVEVL